MPKFNIPFCEMVFDDIFCKYEVSYFGIVEILWGDEVPAYLSGILYGPDAQQHWDEPTEKLAAQLGNGLTINYIPT